jgi:hypothetical protein
MPMVHSLLPSTQQVSVLGFVVSSAYDSGVLSVFRLSVAHHAAALYGVAAACCRCTIMWCFWMLVPNVSLLLLWMVRVASCGYAHMYVCGYTHCTEHAGSPSIGSVALPGHGTAPFIRLGNAVYHQRSVCCTAQQVCKKAGQGSSSVYGTSQIWCQGCSALD